MGFQRKNLGQQWISHPHSGNAWKAHAPFISFSFVRPCAHMPGKAILSIAVSLGISCRLVSRTSFTFARLRIWSFVSRQSCNSRTWCPPTPLALNQRSLRGFGACSCKPAPRDRCPHLPCSFVAHYHILSVLRPMKTSRYDPHTLNRHA